MGGELIVNVLGVEHTLEGWKSHVIGRDPAADLTIADQSVSRRHLILTYEGGVWVAEDLGSTNGTFLDGSMVDRVTVNRPMQLNLGGPSGTPLGLTLGTAATAEPISSMTEPPKLHHFLIVDVVGSTELWERMPEEMHHNIRNFQHSTRRAVRDHHGVVFKTLGDGSCSAFPSSDDALSAGVALTELLEGTAWEGESLAVRAAVHSGEAARYGADLLGPGVNEASKLCDAADSGEILISDRSVELLGGEPESIELGETREILIPGASHPIDVWVVMSS